MNKQILIGMIGIVLFIALILLIVARGPTFAAEAKLIKILPTAEGSPKGLYLEPSDVKIEKNTIVVWLNGVKNGEIQVIFLEGKTCKNVTANGKSFNMNEESCYVTSFMSFGDTSSLQFVETGTYRYYVATSKGDIKTKGTLVVH